MYDFHDYFDGALGIEDIKKLNIQIDFQQNLIYNQNFCIPIYYRDPHEPIKISLNPNEILLRKLPVLGQEDSDVLIPRYEDDNIVIPETITHIQNGLALVEIQNHNETAYELNFAEPIFSQPLDNYETLEPQIQVESDPIRVNDLLKSLRTDHLNVEEKGKLTSLLRKYADIFMMPSDKLSFTNNVKHEIRLKDDTPVHVKSYRYPFALKNEVQNQVSKLLEDGIIRPSQSPYSSPI